MTGFCQGKRQNRNITRYRGQQLVVERFGADAGPRECLRLNVVVNHCDVYSRADQ